MPKKKRSRSSSGDYDKILKKMRKLERKLKKKRRRSVSVSSNSSSNYRSDCEPIFPDEDIPNSLPLDDEIGCEEPQISVTSPSQLPTTAPEATPPALPSLPLPAPEATPTAGPSSALPETQETDTVINLDPDILNLLGEDPSVEKSTGASLHKDIAPRWIHILTNGLAKDVQADLKKQYLFPENCCNLAAPKLNPEIKAALSDLNIKQDEYSKNKQNQLGSGIAALGHVLKWALASKNIVPTDIIKTLSDAGRLLCDNHYRESLSRRYAVWNSLNKNIRDTVKDTKIESNLFGSNLSDHLKSSKAITKTASEMKTRTLYQSQSSLLPKRGALNLKGNPRASAAAIEPRMAPIPSRRPPPPPPPPPRDRRQATAPRGRQRVTDYSRHHPKRR